MIKLELPYPVSANRYWKMVRTHDVTRMALSSDAVRYKKAAKEIALAAGLRRPLEGDVGVWLILRPRLTKKGAASQTILDLDNCIKVAVDALQLICYENDRQVKKIVAEVGAPSDGGALEVVVFKKASGEWQAPLRVGAPHVQD